MVRGQIDADFIFGEEDFAWEEPGLPAAAGAVAVPVAPALQPRPRRPRQTRTFAGDIARLSDAVGLSPLGLGAVLLFVVLAAVAIRLLVAGGETAEVAKSAATPPSTKVAQAPAGKSSAPKITAPDLEKTFEPGDHGAGVRDLQAGLAALGYYDQGADGAYGPGTAAAVAAFQGERGLVVDGVAGPATSRALIDLAVERASADAQEAEDGLAAAVQAGRLQEKDAARYRTVLADSLSALRQLRPGRAASVSLVFERIAENASVYDGPRSLALFGMLEANIRYLARKPLPDAWKDAEGEDGIVYRHVPAHGLQFHPLANFAHLNRLVRKGARDDVRRLATALAARGVPEGSGITWEYYFPFGGPPRWSSALAQAVATQAFARSGALLQDQALTRQARGAFRVIPATLVMELGGGLWIREYGYSDMPILNAQLQSLISISEYARITGDARAKAFAAQMETAARNLIGQFDTGCWSRYSLGGSPASLSYHTYHVSLLKQLARSTGNPVWIDTAARWDGYLRAGQCA